MTQMELLVTNVTELLTTAVHEVLRLMGQAVSEYREESARLHQDNQKLQQRLEEIQLRLRISDPPQQVSASIEEPLLTFGLAADCTLDRQPSRPERPAMYDLSLKEEKPSINFEAGVQDGPSSSPTHKRDSASDEGVGTREILTTIKAESFPDHSGQSPTLCIYDPHHTDPINPEVVPLAFRREGSHECPICGKSFPTPSGLSAHGVCHSGRRPYVCPLCRFSFRRMSDLKKHERIHTGERPYNCTLCGRRFNRGENLRRHLKKVHQHHQLSPYKPHQHIV